MEKWYQAIGRRCSIRDYRSNLTTKQLASLQEFAAGIEAHGVRIAIGRSGKIFSGKLFSSKISGTDCFAAIVSKNGKDVYSGYLGELFILECVSRGYGTCWLGSSFKMSAAQAAVELTEDEEIVCVTPIGIPGEEFELHQRKPISRLTGLSVQEFRALPKWQQCAIEAARRAPSAMNRQPWEFEVYDGKVSVVNVSNNFGYGLLDCGIAMLHMELGAAHLGVSGSWNMDADDEAVFEAEPQSEDADDYYENSDDTDTDDLPDVDNEELHKAPEKVKTRKLSDDDLDDDLYMEDFELDMLMEADDSDNADNDRIL